jgi:U3 small nucleolar RNA-associated protein 6
MDKERVSKIFATMLQVHNKKPNLWIMAAKYEFDVIESIENARNLFQRALRFIPTSDKLWREYFKMELLCVELIMKRKELIGMEVDETSKNQSKVDVIVVLH